MRVRKLAFWLSALFVSVVLLSAKLAAAAPLSPATGGFGLASQLNETHPIIEVRNRGDRVAAGILGGMILGGIIASQRPGYYYGYPPNPYYAPYPYYRQPPMGDPAIAYCLSRFRSYDPYSMTYLGFDGFRHPCP